MFARTVSEYCRSLKEHEIARNAYELICAFDEIVSLGTVDCVNVGQIRTFTEMDSHEEKLQEMLQKVSIFVIENDSCANGHSCARRAKSARRWRRPN